mgnify:FL=1
MREWNNTIIGAFISGMLVFATLICVVLLHARIRNITVRTNDIVSLITLYHPHHPEVSLALGAYLESIGDAEGAKKNYWDAIINNPQWDEGYVRAASVYKKEGNAPELWRVVALYISTHSPIPIDLKREPLNELTVHEQEALLHSPIDLLFSREFSHEVRFGGVLYALGVASLDTAPMRTLRMWSIAASYLPDDGNIQIELASLLQHSLKGPTQSRAILEKCARIQSSAKQCEIYIQGPLHKPGYHALDIGFVREWLRKTAYVQTNE